MQSYNLNGTVSASRALDWDSGVLGLSPCSAMDLPGTYKEVFECVVQELLESNAPESEIDISPHPRLSQALMESKTKKLIKDELEERGFESYREILKQFMRFGQCTTIKFRLSDHPPKPQTAAKKRPPQPKELLKIDVEFKAEQLKICHPENYPSGNIAVLITYLKDVQYTYILLSDSPSHAVQAFFSNQGFAACYYQNGKLRVNLDLCLGSYFDPKGVRLKHWNWWDTDCHVHAPPFQPICIQLNVCIQVKIEAQDQIFLTFTKLHDCLQLNVGARLKCHFDLRKQINYLLLTTQQLAVTQKENKERNLLVRQPLLLL
ncbi:Glutamate-rich protein 6B [Varanus komodoensis]|nr:Glutamate-rich protein 6B [Varanus komodoensis]